MVRTRVVITGLAPLSAIGTGREAFWSALCDGRANLGPNARFDASGFPCRLAGVIEDIPARDAVPKSYRKATKIMARDSELAVVAAQLAAADAGLRTRGSGEAALRPVGGDAFGLTGGRLGCQIGAGLLAADTDELGRAFQTAAREGDPESFDPRRWGSAAGGEGAIQNLQPLWMLKYLPNMLACHVTIIHGAEGASNTITCAESSGLLSLGESARVIERGDADACFSGGLESKLNPTGLARLSVAGRLAETGDARDGSRVTRPFDPASPGAIPGEGGALAILESAPHAAARGARVHAEVLGFGAGHSPPPHFPGLFAPEDAAPEADLGLVRAINAALRDAGAEPSAIDAIAPTAFGLPAVDGPEAGALAQVFGDRLPSIPLITPATAAGACSAGHGALAAAAAALALAHQRLPARLQHGSPDPRLLAGPAAAADAELRRVLVCSIGLGGQCAALVLGRAES